MLELETLIVRFYYYAHIYVYRTLTMRFSIYEKHIQFLLEGYDVVLLVVLSEMLFTIYFNYLFVLDFLFTFFFIFMLQLWKTIFISFDFLTESSIFGKFFLISVTFTNYQLTPTTFGCGFELIK